MNVLLKSSFASNRKSMIVLYRYKKLKKVFFFLITKTLTVKPLLVNTSRFEQSLGPTEQF
jgi:hypothetical protein